MKPRCPQCGRALAANANFCRSCGSQYSPTPGGNRVAVSVAALILVIGGGAAVAILLAGGGRSTTATTRVTPGSAIAAEPIDAGRYVQAGTFQTIAHAGIERRRLLTAGVDAKVVPAGDARQLYPGFQVLVVGPIESPAEEVTTLRRLHRNGVPSAFARRLTPAGEDTDPGSIAGGWAGTLEQTSPEHNGTLPATMTIADGGSRGVLTVKSTGCRARLSLAPGGGPALSYVEEPSCGGVETVWVRRSSEGLMVTLLSPRTNSFALGTLAGT